MGEDKKIKAMARRPKSFGERLQAAKDMAALYKHTQEVRGALALLPEFAVDESGMMDSLHCRPASVPRDLPFEWTGNGNGLRFDF